MPKTRLWVNDDGDLVLPVPIKATETTPAGTRDIVLPEPTMEQLIAFQSMSFTADAALPTIPPTSPQSTQAEIDAALVVANQRAQLAYSLESPHGLAFLDVVKQLTGEVFAPSEVYGWAMNPRAMRALTDHFTRPLDGPDNSEMVQQAVLTALQAMGAR
jgi:hypothetical protein